MKNALQKVVAIVGPTGAGKSQLAIECARTFHGVILSCDSRQIIRGANIGTNKISGVHGHLYGFPSVMRQTIPHFLLDIIEPGEKFSAASFQHHAFEILKKIPKSVIPFLVGGTGLYASAVIDNYDFPQQTSKDLIHKLESLSLPELTKRLLLGDPTGMTIAKTKNKRRMIRAIAVAFQTGKPFSDQLRKKKPIVSALHIGMSLERQKLKHRINERVQSMMKNGFFDEVQTLLKSHGPDTVRGLGIGYGELVSAIEGSQTVHWATQRIERATWQYARRQLTWFQKDKRIHWITGLDQAKQLISDFLT